MSAWKGCQHLWKRDLNKVTDGLKDKPPTHARFEEKLTSFHKAAQTILDKARDVRVDWILVDARPLAQAVHREATELTKAVSNAMRDLDMSSLAQEMARIQDLRTQIEQEPASLEVPIASESCCRLWHESASLDAGKYLCCRLVFSLHAVHLDYLDHGRDCAVNTRGCCAAAAQVRARRRERHSRSDARRGAALRRALRALPHAPAHMQAAGPRGARRGAPALLRAARRVGQAVQ